MNIGTELRHARESRGLSIEAVAKTTRIRAQVLGGIERQDLSALPPRPYARGFVAAYAREVGLDPTETVQGYFAQFEPPPAEVPPAPATPAASEGNRRRLWAAALGIVLLLIAILAIEPWNAQVGDTGEPGAIATSGTSAPPSLAPTASAMGSTPESTAAATSVPPDSAIVIVLETERPSWIAATADGTRLLYRIVPAGTKETLRGSDAITIRVGDAGAVRWSVDGRDPVAMGAPGEVRTVRITPENATSAR